MKKFGVGILLVGMLAAGMARAEDKAPLHWGDGAHSCGRWLADRQVPDSSLVIRSFAWVQGWISALNASLPASASNHGQVGATVDADAAKAWLDKDCREHPTYTLAQASENLYEFLRSIGQ